MKPIENYLKEQKVLIERALDEFLPKAGTRPAVLHEAMRYSVIAGGKRIRPILCLAACQATGGSSDKALVPAIAIEILHTYTLIHDDLPAMDDDDLRRGQPTLHKQFGEANAILAGDALLTLCFEWLARCEPPPPYTHGQLVLELAQASGSQGVIGGQVEDIHAAGKTPSADTVKYIHDNKTGALIRAAVRMGGIVSGAKEEDLDALTRYANTLGLAFQIVDDVLNATSTAGVLGKAAGSDESKGKMTYVATHGLETAKIDAKKLAEEACSAVQTLPGDSAPLQAIAYYVVARDH